VSDETIQRYIEEQEGIKIILTHDVDWPPQGSGIDYILARNYRFSEEVVLKTVREGYNPYFDVPDVMDLEEKYGFKSILFFRCGYKYETLIKYFSTRTNSEIFSG